MSNFNQKGPMGEGPMTGRRMGRCTNYEATRRNQIIKDNENMESPINENFPEQGFGRGFGRRMRRGMGNGMGQNRGGRGMGRSGGGSRGMGIGRQGRFRDDI
ncbi:MAG: DUF5320 domain-containing protein [Dysgonamonadaceae bacterium]|nr:DUF5320 domain-containing protein [Dysgonamonadaceae bacterium]